MYPSVCNYGEQSYAPLSILIYLRDALTGSKLLLRLLLLLWLEITAIIGFCMVNEFIQLTRSATMTVNALHSVRIRNSIQALFKNTNQKRPCNPILIFLHGHLAILFSEPPRPILSYSSLRQ